MMDKAQAIHLKACIPQTGGSLLEITPYMSTIIPPLSVLTKHLLKGYKT